MNTPAFSILIHGRGLTGSTRKHPHRVFYFRTCRRLTDSAETRRHRSGLSEQANNRPGDIAGNGNEQQRGCRQGDYAQKGLEIPQPPHRCDEPLEIRRLEESESDIRVDPPGNESCFPFNVFQSTALGNLRSDNPRE